MQIALVPIILAAIVFLNLNYSVSKIKPQLRQPHTQNAEVLGASVMQSTTSLKTISSFEQKEESVIEEIDYKIIYKDTDDLEYGEEEIVTPGKKGSKEFKYFITYWYGKETKRELVDTLTTDTVTQIVNRGTKVVWRTLDTSSGEIKYWRKLHVWATKYDGNCEGCRGLTFSGTLVRKGVCAVDPKAISLGTNFFVERYGMCRSEDIGGAIKGYHIDLGFEDASKAAWGAEWTNIYLMTSAPDGSDNVVNPWKSN
jgi:3D (Asp-Asp-Asp) domain-containing protein